MKRKVVKAPTQRFQLTPGEVLVSSPSVTKDVHSHRGHGSPPNATDSNGPSRIPTGLDYLPSGCQVRISLVSICSFTVVGVTETGKPACEYHTGGSDWVWG